MYKIDLYMENGGKATKRQTAWYGYVLAYQGKTLHTKEAFGTCEGTWNERELHMFIEAISRCQKSHITVHTDCAYLIGGYKRLEKCKENDWRNSKGEPVKYKELWEQADEACKDKEIEFVMGQHAYTGWLKTMIKEVRKNERKENDTGNGRKDNQSAEIRDEKSRD